MNRATQFSFIVLLSAILTTIALALEGGESGGSATDQNASGAAGKQTLQRIEPTARAATKAVRARTPEDMAEADAVLAPGLALESVPFMPTEESYWSEKAAADTMAAAATRGVHEDKVSALMAEGANPLAAVPLAPPTLRGVSFEGANRTTADTFPPDTHGAVGPSHFVEAVNSRIVVFNKAGTQLKSTSLAAFFGASELVFDPRVVYDQTWNRWVIVATRASASATDTVRRFFLAVSQTSNPAGSYFTYFVNFFNLSAGGPFDNGDWWDYPQLGMDQDAVIITGNVFDTPTAPSAKFAAMMPSPKPAYIMG